MVDDAVAICLVIPQRMRLSDTVTEIWRLKDNGITTLIFWGYVTSSVTWPFDFRGLTSYGWSAVTSRLSGTVTEIWPLPLEVLPGRRSSRNRCRSLVGPSVGPQYYTDLIYFSSLR